MRFKININSFHMTVELEQSARHEIKAASKKMVMVGEMNDKSLIKLMSHDCKTFKNKRGIGSSKLF